MVEVDPDLTLARDVVAKWRIGYSEAIRNGKAWTEMVDAVLMGIKAARAHLTPNTDLSEHVADGVHEELWIADAALRTQRDEVIEEAAKIADFHDTLPHLPGACGAAIRNLKSQDEPVKSGKIA